MQYDLVEYSWSNWTYKIHHFWNTLWISRIQSNSKLLKWDHDRLEYPWALKIQHFLQKIVNSCADTCVCLKLNNKINKVGNMAWLWWVGSIKLEVSFAKEPSKFSISFKKIVNTCAGTCVWLKHNDKIYRGGNMGWLRLVGSINL